MDRFPGTLAILRALIFSDRAPLYARLLWRMRQQRAGTFRGSIRNPSRFSAALHSLMAVLTFLFFYALTPGACFIAFLLVTDHRGLAFWTLILTGLALIGGGAALIAGSLDRAIALERMRHTWPDLLMLPYDRAEIVLNSVVHAYKPFLSMLGLVFALGAALLATPVPTYRSGLLFLLLIVEWLIIQSLSVTTGLIGAFGRYRTAGPTVPMMVAFAGILIRGGAGWVAAKLLNAGEGARLAGILTGPLIGVAAASRLGIGLLLALVYLLILEGLVRLLFAWGVSRAGEE